MIIDTGELMNIPIIKIVLHKAEQQDTVFIFTGIKLPDGSYLSIQLQFPVGTGGAWLNKTFDHPTYETVLQDFEVICPS